ncbi:MAG: deoxyribose-phosphate aldolase [Acetobacteraceae bacterium]|jgi:deoxyribose-phosphate aldolase
MPDVSVPQLAAMIDASIAGRPAATRVEMDAFYRRLAPYRLAAVMVEPRYVRSAVEYFHPRKQPVVTVVSYPLGAMTTEAKLIQMAQALSDGADELDIAMDLSAFRSGDFTKVADELRAMRSLAGDHTVKVIYYSAILSEDDSLHAAELIIAAGITFLKTNPGYGNVTTPAHIRAIKQRFGGDLRVMASGGVRTHQDALAMIEAGADRIATSSPFAVMGVES